MQRISFHAISPQYLATLQLPLHSGRFLDERDVREDLLAVVINEAAVRAYWPGQNALGAYGRLGAPGGSRVQVVGVVGDVRNDGLGKPTVPEIYLLSAFVAINPMRFIVRSLLPPETLVPEVRRAIQSLDPTQPIHHVAMLRDIVHDSMSLERVGSFMMLFFALAALLMASLGIYGVVSYSVRQSTVEIGTRMALGAAGRDLLLMVVTSGLKMAAYGAHHWRCGCCRLVVGARTGFRNRRPRRAPVRGLDGHRCRRDHSGVVLPGVASDSPVAHGGNP